MTNGEPVLSDAAREYAQYLIEHPAEAGAFLVDAGILNADGDVAPEYCQRCKPVDKPADWRTRWGSHAWSRQHDEPIKEAVAQELVAGMRPDAVGELWLVMELIRELNELLLDRGVFLPRDHPHLHEKSVRAALILHRHRHKYMEIRRGEGLL